MACRGRALHGQIHPVTVNVAEHQGHYKGSASLRQTTFGIRLISLMGGTVTVKDDVQIGFDIVTER